MWMGLIFNTQDVSATKGDIYFAPESTLWKLSLNIISHFKNKNQAYNTHLYIAILFTLRLNNEAGREAGSDWFTASGKPISGRGYIRAGGTPHRQLPHGLQYRETTNGARRHLLATETIP